jgi:hypothetical protein
MKTTLLTIAIALALAGCDRTPNQQTPAQSGAGASAPQSNTPSTPANAGTPSAAEKKEGANPVQGHVDPKQPEQTKDFQPKPGG